MKVSISSKSAPTSWGENALLASTSEGFDIHLPPDDDRSAAIQQAARKISVLGVPEVSLTGSNWKLNDQWSFALG